MISTNNFWEILETIPGEVFGNIPKKSLEASKGKTQNQLLK